MTSVKVDPTPFSEGNEAFASGTAREACPYAVGSNEQHEWLAGWEEAARYAKENMR